MLKNFFRLIMLLIFINLNTIVKADLRLVITDGVNTAKPIAIVPFEYNGDKEGLYKIEEVIISDLKNSGKFTPLELRKMPQIPSNVIEIKHKEWSALGIDTVLVGKINYKGSGQYLVNYQLVDTLNNPGKLLIENQFTITKDLLRLAAHTISDEVFETLTGIKGSFKTKIAYIVKLIEKNQYDELRISDYDGLNEVTVHRSVEPLMSPTWSPDGKNIAFVTFEGGKSKLVIKTLKTGAIETIADYPQHNGAPAFSPDGTKIAFALSKDGNLNLFLLELKTKYMRQITFGRSNNTEPAWMPDNKTLIYTSDQTGKPQIYSLNIDNSYPQRITWNGSQNQNAKVSNDGTFAVLISTLNGYQNVTKFDFETNTYRTLTNTFLDETPSISPNGSMIIYSSSYGLKTILNLVSSDGNFKARLPITNGNVKFPSWSPYLN